jgi:ABC-type glycerol-3-phosphate transport system permease component
MGMEDDTRAFLVLIVNTIAIVLLWMIANVLFGIYWGYGFYEDKLSWKNIIYYILAAGTFIFMIRHIRRKWKGWF